MPPVMRKAGHQDLFFQLLLKVYLERERERERENEQERGRERRRDRIPSRLHTIGTDPSVGLEPTNHEIMTRAEIKRQTLN